MTKSVSILTVAVVFTFAISGCSSGWKLYDPFALSKNENTGKLRIVTTANLLGAKVNGVYVGAGTPEIIVPSGKNEFEIAVLLSGGAGRGLASQFKNYMVIGKAELNIESGKTYALVTAEATGSAVTSIFLGSFVPIGAYRLVFQEYASKIKLVKLGEFPATKFDGKDWEKYQYPSIKNQE